MNYEENGLEFLQPVDYFTLVLAELVVGNNNYCYVDYVDGFERPLDSKLTSFAFIVDSCSVDEYDWCVSEYFKRTLYGVCRCALLVRYNRNVLP